MGMNKRREINVRMDIPSSHSIVSEEKEGTS